MRAAIFGCSGFRLSDAEKAFFADAAPWGFILFTRNLDTPDQSRALTSELREVVGRNAPILIDQEGGRVARLRQPHWREWLPPLEQMKCVDPSDAREAMALRYRLIAHELRDLGIDVNCAPMLDVIQPNTHEIITNRCYGDNVDVVAEMGRAVAEGLLAGGVLPIIKHIPGHGRADLDSHFDLPVVATPRAELEATDFVPFMRLSDLPMAMTAHIIYSDIDAERPATTSPQMNAIIRNDFGFDGLLMTDDLSMKALSGTFESRTVDALAAGCDVVLHCNGAPAEMRAVMTELPELTGDALRRADAALEARKDPLLLDVDATQARFNALLKA